MIRTNARALESVRRVVQLFVEVPNRPHAYCKFLLNLVGQDAVGDHLGRKILLELSSVLTQEISQESREAVTHTGFAGSQTDSGPVIQTFAGLMERRYCIWFSSLYGLDETF